MTKHALMADLIHHRKALTLFKTFGCRSGDTASCGDSERQEFFAVLRQRLDHLCLRQSLS